MTSKQDRAASPLLNDMASWMDVIQVSGAGAPGDVILIYKNVITVDVIVGWALACKNICDPLGEKAYTHFKVVLFPGHGLNMQRLDEGLSSAGASEYIVTQLSTMESRELLEVLQETRDGSALLVPGLESMHAATRREECDISQRNWAGVSLRLETENRRFEAKIAPFLSLLIDISKKKSIYLTGLCAFPEAIFKQIHIAFKDVDNLMILSPISSEEEIAGILERLVQQFNAGSISIDDAVKRLNEVSGNEPFPELLMSQLHFWTGHFHAAWKEVAPVYDVISESTSSICFYLAQVAFSAGKTREAKELLLKSVAGESLNVDEMKAAHSLSLNLGLTTLSENLLRELVRLCPNDEQIVKFEYEDALSRRNYRVAQQLATRLNLQFEAAIWSCFCNDTVDLDDVEEKAKVLGRMDELAIEAAREYFFRRDYALARIWAERVTRGSKFEPEAIAIRIRSIGRDILSAGRVEDDDIDRLSPLFEYVASHPRELSARFAFEELFEETLSHEDSLFIICVIIDRAIPNSVSTSLKAMGCEKPEERVIDDALVFIKSVIKSFGSKTLVFGVSRLEERFRKDVTPELLDGMLYLAQEMKADEGSLQSALLVLNVIELSAAELNEPTKDMIAALFFVQQLAFSGAMQQSRNLAEEVIRSFPGRVRSKLNWRLGLGWLIFAEAFSRTGNAVSGLRCMCLCFLSIGGDYFDVQGACIMLRTYAKLLRNSGLMEMALDAVAKEESIWRAYFPDSDLSILEHVRLSIKVKMSASPEECMQYLREAVDMLVALPEGSEEMPLLSLVISLMREVKASGHSVSPVIIETVREKIGGQGGLSGAIFGGLLEGAVSKEAMLKILEKIGVAARKGDLAFQSFPAKILSEDGVTAACESNDIDLFTISASLQSQPVLSAVSFVEAEKEVNSGFFRRSVIEKASVEKKESVMADIANTIKEFEYPSNINLIEVCSSRMELLQGFLVEGELALVLAFDQRGVLCVCAAKKTGMPVLYRLGDDVGSKDYLELLQSKLQGGHENLYRDVVDGWTLREIERRISELRLVSVADVELVTILPPAELFDFPFFFTSTDTGILGKVVEVVIAPSIAWIISARNQGKKYPAKAIAWMGSPVSSDETMKEARKWIAPLLSERGASIIDSLYDSEAICADLMLLLSHGNKGEFSEFHGLNDGVDLFSTAELVDRISGCGCVVLLACHAGVAPAMHGTSEVRGLVGSLLASGTRVVVACSWPITLETVNVWVRRFLDEFNLGKSVSRSVFLANQDVESHVRDSIAWGSLRVFGDGQFSRR